MKKLRSRLLLLALCAGFATSAHAQVEVSYVDQVVLEKDMDTVYSALMSYGQWCEKGCRYVSPGVVVDEKLDIDKGKARFYTWTWISDVKDTKYFSEIKVHKSATSAKITSRALTSAEKDKIKELEKATGRTQDALFDTSTNSITLQVEKDKNGGVVGTRIHYDTRVKVSGFLAMFPGKLRAGLKDSTQAVFKALKS